jgi:hypothetical protein
MFRDLVQATGRFGGSAAFLKKRYFIFFYIRYNGAVWLLPGQAAGEVNICGVQPPARIFVLILPGNSLYSGRFFPAALQLCV